MEDAPGAAIAEDLKWLAELPDAAWDEYQLRKDPVYSRIAPEQRDAIPRAAATAAAVALERLRDAFGTLPPTDYAERLCIAIHHERPSGMGRAPFLSLAVREPPAIIVSPEAMRTVTEQIDLHGLAPGFASRYGWSEAAIAHELFHHLEWRTPTLPALVGEVITWRLGPFRLRCRPVSAEEIAAMYFARLLAGCAVRPDVLELLYLAGVDPDRALAWIGLLKGISAAVNMPLDTPKLMGKQGGAKWLEENGGK